MGKQSSSPEPTLVLAKKQPGTWQEEVLHRPVCLAACLSPSVSVYLWLVRINMYLILFILHFYFLQTFEL